MNSASLPLNALAADAKSLNALKLQASQATPAAIKEAAKQFESLFMRELIKSMREATQKSGMMDSAQGDLGEDLLDQQLAVQMSGLPGGLSDSIARQLAAQMGTVLPAAASAPTLAASTLSTSALAGASSAAAASTPAYQNNFVKRMGGVAASVEKASGIPAAYMIGQAAHETAWGQKEIRLPDGSPSFNLFGIKAGAGWNGKVAEVTTTEYLNGVAHKVVAKFRAYDSYEAAFHDYAHMITASPRYAQARQQTGSAQAYANGLQQAGYATDPAYAAKLSQTINHTLRLQRLQA